MCGFVTWPPFSHNKGGQVTKPIIVVKICYKLLYVIQVVKRFLISNFLASTDIKVLVAPVCNAASNWLRTFFTPKVFLFSIQLTSYLYKVLTFHIRIVFTSYT